MSMYTLIEINNDHLDTLENDSKGLVSYTLASACRNPSNADHEFKIARLTGVRVVGQSGHQYEDPAQDKNMLAHYKRTLAQTVDLLEQAYKEEKEVARVWNRPLHPWAATCASTFDFPGDVTQVPVPKDGIIVMAELDSPAETRAMHAYNEAAVLKVTYTTGPEWFHEVSRLNPTFKDDWINMLRCGSLVQGQKTMMSKAGKFCCLGVGCLADSAPHRQPILNRGTPTDDELTAWFEDTTKQNTDIMIGLYDRRKVEGGPSNNPITLIVLNDEAGMTFDQIADVIAYFL